jgi:streptogramin lyase
MRFQQNLPAFSQLFTSRRTNAQARTGRSRNRRFSPQWIGLEQKALLAAVPTVLNVTSSKLVSNYGSQVLLHASVTTEPAKSIRPSGGTVTFYDIVNGQTWTTLGTVPLANGHAFLTTTALSRGQNQITAVYSGDTSNFAGSTFPANPYQVIKTVAGGDQPAGPALEVGISPRSIVSDKAGNLFFTNRNTVLKYDVNTQQISVLAGTGVSGFSGDGGPATAAKLKSPTGLAINKYGDVFFGDNARVRKVQASTGIITTVAGNGEWWYGGGDGGPAIKAGLSYVSALVFDSRGNLFVADSTAVHKIDSVTGIISVVIQERCDALAINSSDDLFLTGSRMGVVQKLDHKTGTITTIAGNGTFGFRGDGGNAIDADLRQPRALAIDKHGDLLIADEWDGRVRKVSLATGIISTVAGTYSSSPTGLALDMRGNLFITDESAHVILRVDQLTSGVNTIAGNGTKRWIGDGGLATNAQLLLPKGVAIDPTGNLYVADSDFYSQNVRKISVATGIITTIAGNGFMGLSNTYNGVPATETRLSWPRELAFDTTHNLFIANQHFVYKVDNTTGLIYRVAGNGAHGYTGDGGLASDATFAWLAGIAVDGAGNLFIADSGNNVIRKVIASTGIVQTVAGTGVAGSSGDGGPATEAQLHNPKKIAVDFNGNLYIADYQNDTIRRVDAVSQTITTFAGKGAFSGYAANGKPATNVSLSLDNYGAMTADPNGNLWVVDYNTGLMKINTQTGIVSTPIHKSLVSDFGSPDFIAVDSVGNVFFSEGFFLSFNGRVRAALVRSSLRITVNATPPAASVRNPTVTIVPSGPTKTTSMVKVQSSGLLNPYDATNTAVYGPSTVSTGKAKARTIASNKAVYDSATPTARLYPRSNL